jgi:acyl-CoA dehydrogenase
MPDKSFLAWPFFEEGHRELAAAIETWCRSHLPVDRSDVDGACRTLVAALGRDGWLMHSAADPETSGAHDVRALCLIRETLARHDGLADFAFAMQGLGAGAISLFGTIAQRQWLKRTRTSIERLYREIRALRIYEGASEIQKVIIARQMLSGG